MNVDELLELPVHGKTGRIARVRSELRMSQTEFALAVGTSRETVSHWENVDERGDPRQRTTRRKSEAIAELVRERLDLDVRDDAFYGWGDNPLEALRRDQTKMAADLERALELLEQLTERLAREN
jgi:DNA-binding XRE family transcriptional regulator